MSEPSEVRVVLCTAPPDHADRLARLCVERRLAACVNIVPGVRSVYRWKGRIEKEEERLLVIKTLRSRFEALRDALVAEHPYEVPEVISLGVEAGHRGYLEWVARSVGGAEGGRPEGAAGE